MKISVSIFITLFFSITAMAGEADSTRINRGIIGGLIHYFESSNKHEVTTRPNFTFIAGPHYSSEKGFGLGMVVGGAYSTCPEDSTLPHSNISIVGDIATKGYYMAGLKGEHVLPGNNQRINYAAYVEDFKTYYWGIGYESAKNDANKVKYTSLGFILHGTYEWRIWRNLYLGPAVEIKYADAKHPEHRDIWEGRGLSGINIGAGAVIKLDTRDNHTFPRRGIVFEVNQLFFPRFIGNGNRSFSRTDINMSLYKGVWQGAVLAANFNACFTYGSTPWYMLPTLGGNAMRGYYEGRYLDKCSSSVVAEIRQHIYRRSSIATWVGAGTVFHSFSCLRLKEMLPEFGMGYRWEFKRNSNIRIDFGIGRHSTGFVFGLNEAF